MRWNLLNSCRLCFLATLVFILITLSNSTLQAQDLRVGQALLVIEDETFEVELVESGTAKVAPSQVFHFFEPAPGHYVCYLNGKQALIPTKAVAVPEKAIGVLQKRCEGSQTADHFLFLALALKRTGKYRAAVIKVNAGLELDSEHFELKLLKWELGVMDRESDQDELLDEILSVKTDDIKFKARLMTIEALSIRKRKSISREMQVEAFDLMEEAEKLALPDHFVLSTLATAAGSGSAREKEVLDKIKALDPVDSYTIYRIARNAWWQGNIEEANKIMEKALELNPHSDPAWEYFYQAAYVAGDREKANEVAFSGAKSPCNGYFLKRARGLVAWQLATGENEVTQDLDGAELINELYFESIKDDDPMMKVVLLNRIAIECERGEFKKATKMFQELDESDFVDEFPESDRLRLRVAAFQDHEFLNFGERYQWLKGKLKE